jgi:periplasmic copper chaperone A
MRILTTAALGIFSLVILASPIAGVHAQAPDPHQHGHGASHNSGHHPGHGASVQTIGDLEISGYWTRATLPNQRVGGGYLAITNTGSTDDRLVAVTSDATDRVEIHEMSMENDVMTMRLRPDGLPVPAGETVALEPGGYHLMFMDLVDGFAEGESVRATLRFEQAGDVTIELPVLPASAGRGGSHQH